ncbi:hypothetical protein ANN_06457 [Periplaneta americana]|uniref:Mutator-like transposase domain-containing protein n=1 Tax=Periplaneta americana TaxID=6978 RepID=A0ABQ8TG37_PERAM|nr:hypothetical protein ANN_06457 [Periplaneta americana]
MNMPPPTIRYTDTNNVLLKSLKKVCDESMTKAVQQAVSVNDCDGNDLSMSCDGTWMRRGFSSLYGVSTVVSIDTERKVEIKMKRSNGKKNHAKSCCKNYHGSSGGMEAAGLKLIFHRSQEKYGVRYVKYLGDGDSSAFKSVFESEPYGSDCPIEKLECVGHVQKRMGSRLLKLTKDMKGKKLEDVVQIATLDAILVYNDGNIGRIRTLQELGFEPGAFTINILQGIDSRRIDSANTALKKIQQEARQRRSLKRKEAEDLQEEQEYGAGDF